MVIPPPMETILINCHKESKITNRRYVKNLWLKVLIICLSFYILLSLAYLHTFYFSLLNIIIFGFIDLLVKIYIFSLKSLDIMLLMMYWNKNLDFARDHFLLRKKHKDWSVGENTYILLFCQKPRIVLNVSWMGRTFLWHPFQLYSETDREKEKDREV